jgi:hypothetical protein
MGIHRHAARAEEAGRGSIGTDLQSHAAIGLDGCKEPRWSGLEHHYLDDSGDVEGEAVPAHRQRAEVVRHGAPCGNDLHVVRRFVQPKGDGAVPIAQARRVWNRWRYRWLEQRQHGQERKQSRRQRGPEKSASRAHASPIEYWYNIHRQAVGRRVCSIWIAPTNSRKLRLDENFLVDQSFLQAFRRLESASIFAPGAKQPADNTPLSAGWKTQRLGY